MLPKPNRLPSSEVKSVMRRGRRVHGDGVQLIVARNTLPRMNAQARVDIRVPASRFAFIVPVSVDKRAAVRNRARRLVRESVRLALPAIAPGWDGFFFVRKRLPDEFGVVDGNVRELLRRAGVLRSES